MTTFNHALITGGSGFIGTHLTTALLDLGLRVTVVSRSDRTWRRVDSRATFVQANLGELDLDDMLRGVDAVYHLAWSTIPKTANDDPARDVLANVPSAIRLAEAAVRAKVGLFVFASTGGAIYGDDGARRLLPENASLRPVSSYGISKLTVERYLALYRRHEGLNAVAIRASNAYGPLQDPESGLGALTAFTWRVLRHEPIEVWGDGSVVRDFLYISDLVNAYTKTLTTLSLDPELPVYNIASGDPLSINALIERVIDVLGARVDVRRGPSRHFDVRHVALDIARARSELGWTPQVSLDEGIAATAAWIQTWQRTQSPSL